MWVKTWQKHKLILLISPLPKKFNNFLLLLDYQTTNWRSLWEPNPKFKIVSLYDLCSKQNVRKHNQTIQSRLQKEEASIGPQSSKITSFAHLSKDCACDLTHRWSHMERTIHSQQWVGCVGTSIQNIHVCKLGEQYGNYIFPIDLFGFGTGLKS